MKPFSPVNVLLIVFTPLAHAATVAQFSTAWTPLIGNYDYLGDQQGAVSGDIVGSRTDYGLFTTFNDNGSSSNTDGTLGFRIRLDTAGGPSNKPAFDRAAWIGIDADLNGSVDVFIGANFSGSATDLGIYAAGTGLNTSPNTTTIASAPYKSLYTISTANFNYRPVDFGTNKDGGTTNDVTTTSTGDPDYYVSFMVPFADVASFLSTKSINITDQTSLRYVSATATQGNNLNQDLGGVNGNLNSTDTWANLGGFTQIVNTSGTVVPEPSACLFALASLVVTVTRRKR